MMTCAINWTKLKLAMPFRSIGSNWTWEKYYRETVLKFVKAIKYKYARMALFMWQELAEERAKHRGILARTSAKFRNSALWWTLSGWKGHTKQVRFAI